MYKYDVIGFDAREMWLDADQLWTQNRRDRFLLKPDVHKPLSVDSYIWYDVFSEVIDAHLWTVGRDRKYPMGKDAKYSGNEWDDVFSDDKKLTSPDGYQSRRAWRNLNHRRTYLNQMWGDRWKPCVLVAVAELYTEDESEEPVVPPEQRTPDYIDPSWELLGYDVADYDLITGLFEGEIASDEMPDLRHKWGSHLNEYHLFADPQKAFDYIPVANKRFPSHMPYGVFALYHIEKHNVI